MPPRNRTLARPPAFSYGEPKPSQPAGHASSRLLHCDEASLADLAQRFGTPLYVYSATTIRHRMRDFDRAFRKIPHTVCYSVKANSNLSILRLLAKLGCGFDVVSGGELRRVLRASPGAATKVVFSGVGKTPDEMRMALRADILLFNVESESELECLAECAARVKKKARIALRVNPDVPAKTHPYISTGLHQHKFGIPIDQAHRLYRRASAMKSLEIAGVSVHIGSQITSVTPFAATMKRVAELTTELRSEGHSIRYVDAGGGLGISYEATLPDFARYVASYADALIKPIARLKLHLLLEPGRCIVGPAGVLITRLLFKKTNGTKNFLVVDAAMNDLMRPSLYNAHHEIIPIQTSNSPKKQLCEIADVVGPICETGDFFARGRKLPVMQEGDLLALLDTGAYGMVLASNYNTRPRAAEVLVDGKSIRLIRRRETMADLVRGEI
jgi:diaminopimelate decarboxylase